MKKQNQVYTLSGLVLMVTTGTFLLVKTYSFLETGFQETAHHLAPYMHYVTY
jgi:hypothetical protein